MSTEVHLNQKTGEFAPGLSLFECADALGVRIPTSCHKNGRCKECIVEVTEGLEFLSSPDPAENHLKDTFRLACCARLAPEASRVRARTMRRGEMRIERQASGLPARPGQATLDPAVHRVGSRVFLDEIKIGESSVPAHGIAIDIGTTTVVVRLLNLETGERVADCAFENPQRFGGSDIMARISYDTVEGKGLLQRTLAGYLAHAIEELPIPPENIYEAVVVGNTTMRDLFFRLNVFSIGQSPYQSITEVEQAEGRRPCTSVTANARRLGLPIHPQARAYGCPIISGHVGADAAACALAINLAEEDRLVALMDIGTNTELLLGNRHKVMAASCPAGPAFEGGRIARGMPGLPGAIERVRWNESGWRVEVIGGGPPSGICGSGLVETLSELRRTGQMNSLGRLQDGLERVVLSKNADGEIYLSEADINELAQAKGANAAGLQILFDRFGARFEDLECFYLAGGFGRHLDPEAAQRVGLIPNLPLEKIIRVGNAAIEGACLALLSVTRRRELESLVQRISHCRLETHPEFFNCFVDGCQFLPLEPMAGATARQA